MGRWKQRRHQPSEVACHRLGEAIRQHRAELEVRLAEGLLRTELYLETGQPERAAAVLEEQRRRLLDFDTGLRDALADAAVEAEAEAVIARAADAERLHGRGPAVSRFPQLVAASLAAVASLALLAVAGVDRGDDGLRASVRIDATDRLPSTGLHVSPPTIPLSLRFEGYGVGASDFARALAPSSVPEQAETGRWLAEQDGILARLGVDVRVRSEVIRELEGLVATLEPGSPLTDEMWLQVLAEAEDVVERRSDGQQPPAEDDASPAEEDQAPPADEDDREDRGSWIDPRDGGEDQDAATEGEEAPQDEDGAEGPNAPEAPSDGDGSEGSSDAPSAPGADAAASGSQGDDGSFLSGS